MRGTLRLPALMVLVLLVAGAAEFEETRGVVAEVATIAAPAVAMTVAVAPLREAFPGLRNAAFATAGGLAVLAESVLVPNALGHHLAPPAVLAVALVLLALGLVPIEALAVRRGFALRPAALGGMVTVLALFLPAWGHGTDPLGGVLATAIVAVFMGGGLGFAAGVVGRLAVGARA